MCVGQKFDINVAYVASYVYLGKYLYQNYSIFTSFENPCLVKEDFIIG